MAGIPKNEIKPNIHSTTVEMPTIAIHAGLVSLPAATYASLGRMAASMKSNTPSARAARVISSITVAMPSKTSTRQRYGENLP